MSDALKYALAQHAAQQGQLGTVTGNSGFYAVNPLFSGNSAGAYSDQLLQAARENAYLRERVKAAEERADAWGRQTCETQGNAEAAAETLRMLLEAMSGLHSMLAALEWRKRRADKEEYCPCCEVLKSTFGGNHTPSCQLSGALRLTAPGKWTLLRRPAQKPSPREA